MAIPPADTRGILSPAQLLERVRLSRYEVPEPLAGLVDRFWSVSWDLPRGPGFRQDLVAQPGVNISVGNPPPPGPNPPRDPYRLRCVVNGVATELTTRVLGGAGWNLAAKTTTGGFGAWVDDVSALTDRVVPGPDVLAVRPDLAAEVARVEPGEGVDLLAEALVGALRGRPSSRVAQARETARVAAVAEHDRGVTRVAQLAALAGVSARTLQRTFASCAGVSPTWVIRRFRLIEAADLVREGAAVDWAEVAARLGYADQPHLIADFRRTIGSTPEAYARAQRRDVGR